MDSCGRTCPLVASVQVVLRKAPGCLQGARHRRTASHHSAWTKFYRGGAGIRKHKSGSHTCAEYLAGSGPRRRQVWERLLGSTEMTRAPSPLVYKAQPEPQWLQPTREKCPEFSCQPCEWGWWKRHRRTLPSPT